jgi:DNA gyrase/topoisomerase IV subunit B
MEIQSYTDEHLKGLSDRDHIRLNATGLIVSTDMYGQYHTIKEVLDNSIDEISILPDAHMDVYFFQDLKNKRYQTVVIDTGRGFPLGKVYQAVTELKFSGKFTTDAYKTSSGMFGYGLTVAVNLAKRYRVITHRENQVVSVDNLDDSPLPVQSKMDYLDPMTGTVVALDVLDEIFTDVDKFTMEGYNKIIHFLQILSIFSHVTVADPNHQKYRFFLYTQPIHEEFWTLDAATAATYIQKQYEHRAIKLYDSLDANNSNRFLSDLWELDTSFVWSEENIFKREMFPTENLVDPKDKRKGYVHLGYDVRLYIPKLLRSGKCLSLVNNVVIRNQNSSHISVVTKILKSKLRSRITDEAIQKYFDNHYDLPIYYAMSIFYQGAKFSGYTKDGFISDKFEKVFEKALLEQMEELPSFYWDEVFDYIVKHIETSYNIFYNKPMSTNKLKNAMLETKIKWYDCESNNREEAELFIVEGTSAAHITNARDPNRHAVMLIKGKPTNIIIDKDNVAKSIELLYKYTAYKDLTTILNTKPEHIDLSNCRFGKIIISTDADSDGYHIAASHVGAFYMINPLLISSGIVHVANPPLYEVFVTTRGKKILLRDKYDLMMFRANSYAKFLDIYYKHKDSRQQPKLLKNDGDNSNLFTGLCVVVTELGEYITEYAEQFAVPAEILERLAMVTYALDPHRPNIGIIEAVLNTKVHYIQSYKTIRIESMPKDIVISLPTFRQQLYDTILPLLKQYAWDKTELYVSTKATDKYKMQRMSYMQLFSIFRKIDEGFHVKRHKGLGGMNEEDLRTAFINESTRKLKQITSIGDVDVLYSLLGVDVTGRKRMMIEQGMITGE